jgi:Dolichyl-phosphate-mannose-protein mannosyltransferase
VEIQSRAIPSRILTRVGSAAPLGAVIAAAVVLVVAQPVTGPWWLNADADATYSASALNIISGNYSRYFDHPGLPTQEVLALTFGAVSLTQGGPTRAWARSEMLHLDRARPVFRGWAILFFVGGAALAYALLGRLFGHWTWGLAGGLLWLAQPDLTDTIQIRPDMLLCILLLLAGYVTVRSWERRSALGYAVAAVISGVAFMTKLNAVAIIPMIVAATVLSYPGQDWWPNALDATRSFVAKHRLGVGLTAGAWVTCFFLLNWQRLSVSTAGMNTGLLGVIAFAIVDYALVTSFVRKVVRNRVARRIFDPFYLALAGAFAVGVAIPLLLVLKYSPLILSLTFETLTGHNVNAGISTFDLSFHQFTSFPLLEVMIVLGAAAAAALLGAVRRDAFPALWFAGAGASTVMAMARLSELRYYAPGYVLAIPAALWLFRRQRSLAAPIVVWLLVAGVVVPTFVHRNDEAHYVALEQKENRAATQIADRVLKPGEIALLPNYGYPVPDTRWWELLHEYVYSPPAYPYRFLPDDPSAIQTAVSQGDQVRYYLGSAALGVHKRQMLTLVSGTYEVEPVKGEPGDPDLELGVVRLLSGPGT